MARCTNCNCKWKIKNMWLLGFSKKGRACPHCGTRQFASFKESNVLIGLGSLSGIIAILLIMFFPFFIKLSDKEETAL
ncbi:MAG: hypothetical protein ACI35R_00020 [Bacillus sp. (in: firmicutes)]